MARLESPSKHERGNNSYHNKLSSSHVTVKIEIGCPFFTLFGLYRTDILAWGVFIAQLVSITHTVSMYLLLTAYIHGQKARRGYSTAQINPILYLHMLAFLYGVRKLALQYYFESGQNLT